VRNRLVWLGVGLVACARSAPLDVVPQDAAVSGARYQNAHLLRGAGRAALGRFIDPDAWPIDETMALQTACSQHFEVVRQDEAAGAASGVFSGPPELGPRFGLPADAPAVVFVDHRPDANLMAAIKAPDALRACCEAQPDACTAAFVGELVEGSGRSYRPQGDPVQWFAAGRVSGAFGFRLVGNPYVGDDCGLWRQHPPTATAGRYVLGVSNATFTEDNARADARSRVDRDARAWLREQGQGEAAVQRLREERWCVESFPGAGGTQYVATVLTWLPPAM
jgi:hypothetical protein